MIFCPSAGRWIVSVAQNIPCVSLLHVEQMSVQGVSQGVSVTVSRTLASINISSEFSVFFASLRVLKEKISTMLRVSECLNI